MEEEITEKNGFWTKLKNTCRQWMGIRKPLSAREQLMKETNYGRDFGWYILLEDEILGELVGYQFHDMFWDSYQVIIYDEEAYTQLSDKESWYNGIFKFKNKELEEFADYAFPGGLDNIDIRTDRIIMRRLYLDFKTT